MEREFELNNTPYENRPIVEQHKINNIMKARATQIINVAKSRSMKKETNTN